MYEDLELREVPLEQSLAAILQYLDAKGEEWLHATTRLIILPTYPLRVVQGLITNFHLPESTLIMLVSALAGKLRFARGVLQSSCSLTTIEGDAPAKTMHVHTD